MQAESQASRASMQTFKLFKLHGSINWFYSGRQMFFGEELFCVPCVGGIDGVFDDKDVANLQLLKGKCPLIVPPVPDKSDFFQHESLHSMWSQAEIALKKTERVVCLGYSFPEGDSHMIQFLQRSAPEKRIRFEIVDLKRNEERLKEIVGVGLYDFHQNFEGQICIPNFVSSELIQDKQDRILTRLEFLPAKTPARR